MSYANTQAPSHMGSVGPEYVKVKQNITEIIRGKDARGRDTYEYVCTDFLGEGQVKCDINDYCMPHIQFPGERCIKPEKFEIEFPASKPCGNIQCPIQDHCMRDGYTTSCVHKDVVRDALLNRNDGTFACGEETCDRGEICYDDTCKKAADYTRLVGQIQTLMSNQSSSTCPSTESSCECGETEIITVGMATAHLSRFQDIFTNRNIVQKDRTQDMCVIQVCWDQGENATPAIASMTLSDHEKLPDIKLKDVLCVYDTSQCSSTS